MKITVVTVNDATQAKLIIKPRPLSAIIKIPGFLSHKDQETLKNKLVNIANKHLDTRQFLKIFYKIGKPYLFLNKKVNSNKKKTVAVYKFEEV